MRYYRPRRSYRDVRFGIYSNDEKEARERVDFTIQTQKRFTEKRDRAIEDLRHAVAVLLNMYERLEKEYINISNDGSDVKRQKYFKKAADSCGVKVNVYKNIYREIVQIRSSFPDK